MEKKQKLPEAPERKRDDTCAKKEPSRQKKETVLFQQWLSKLQH